MSSSDSRAEARPGTLGRPRVDGKFLSVNGERFIVRGATYGSFAPNSFGDQFPEPAQVARDFELMQAAGVNSILTYTVPPISLLDQAAEHGIRVIVNIPWMAYVCFLDSAASRRAIRDEVRDGVAACRRHPAVLMYCVAKELPPQIVRWHGRKRIQRFLRDLYGVAKDEESESLVTYTNFPTTEYLELPFVDVFTFNVYLHGRDSFTNYISRLQHLAGELPLVLTEIGMCSFRHGREGQARFIDWQLEESFRRGAAGAVIFGWTDPFYQDNCLIEEWGFGLVDGERQPKPSYDVVRRRFAEIPVVQADDSKPDCPKVSVVVALHNAASTLEGCLASLQQLRYPNYEVIVVNDGSTDHSQTIIDRFAFHSISTPNRGISAARNEGLRAASGEIVAYIDSDARADPEWLSYLVTTFQDSDFVGVGGPNLIPEEDNWVANCVYRAPGGPTQVMLDDHNAEHIPGCNMAFRRSVLDEIDGFDAVFTNAGDDVDLCWRILERNYKIGFSPSAVVWHHRRPSIRAYWRQQVGYGVSEALLERKHSNKFNAWGHTHWGGQIYAPYPFFRLFDNPVIYHGRWGSAGFQGIYGNGDGGMLSFLPRSMEWHIGLAALAVFGLVQPWTFGLVAVGAGYTAWYCVATAAKARLPYVPARSIADRMRRLRSRATIALLNFLEPIARDWGRIRGGLTPWRSVGVTPQGRLLGRWWQRLLPLRRTVGWERTGGGRLEKIEILERLTRVLNRRGLAVGWNDDTDDWDLKVGRGVLGGATVGAVVEHHGGPHRLARLRAVIRPSRALHGLQALLVLAAVVMGVGGLTWAPLVCLALLAPLWVGPIVEANRLERVLHAAAEQVADRLEAEQRQEADSGPTS